MSRHMAFRRQPVDQQFAQNLRAHTIPAPTRGVIENESEPFMQPGGAVVCDNWAPTMRGVKLRGGTIKYCDLHALDYPAWTNSTSYGVGTRAYDSATTSFWDCLSLHTSAATGTFAADRAGAAAGKWANTPIATTARKPVISGFEYVSGTTARMFAAQVTKLFDVTNALPILVKSGQTSGNYAAAQMANAAQTGTLGTNWLIAVNDAGNYPLRYNGSTWVTLDPTSGSPPGTPADGAPRITGPAGSNVVDGTNLTYVWKYRNRLFFLEANSMNVWYLPTLNSVGGVLTPIPMAGAASRGGKLLFGASWSMDAGDGLDEKCIFVTDQGEVLIFTGSNPADPASWRQQGRYYLSPPLGMNAHLQVGGDMLILTVDGIVPLSQAITKDAGQLELAMLTRTIKRSWREDVANRRSSPWTIKKWDEYGAIFVAVPGGLPGQRYCRPANNATGAWARFVGWDATCFLRLRADMFFGTQDGLIMQAERSGYDWTWNSKGELTPQAYVATLVGGWEMFGAPANQFVWHQARANFRSGAAEPFQPQLSACVNHIVDIPPPPSAGPDPGVPDVWDQAVWCPTTPAYDPPPGGTTPPPADMVAYGQWDQPAPQPAVRDTLWVSIGQTGYAHAPIVQVTVAQTVTPSVELLAIGAVYEPAGVNV